MTTASDSLLNNSAGSPESDGQHCLNQSSWRTLCEAFNADAINRCGLSDFLYTEFYSVAVDGALATIPLHERETALNIARDLGDYMTPEEREVQAQWNEPNGYCSHGIDRDCCPAGCGDIER